jgi:CheY-like chemotaxis protein
MKAVALQKNHKAHAIAQANEEIEKSCGGWHKVDRFPGDLSEDIPRSIYDPDKRRISVMDEAGNDLQILSHTVPRSEEMDPSIAIGLARKVNNCAHTIRLAATPSDDISLGAGTQQGRQRQVLCVDDEVIATNARAEMLREYGYHVHVCNSPIESLHYDLASFDLAVVDFEMPALNGRDLLLRMRASGAHFPIILLTGDLGALSHEDCVLFARCIDKIAPIHLLLDSIAEFLGPSQVSDYGS